MSVHAETALAAFGSKVKLRNRMRCGHIRRLKHRFLLEHKE